MAELAEIARTSSPEVAAEQVLTVFGRGMGGFADLVLQDASGVRPEQWRLHEMREELFVLAQQLRGVG